MYIASDKDTALQELLSQKIDITKDETKLKPLDFALTKPDSLAMISVSGMLDSVINLKQPKHLEPFIDLIKNFSISDAIIKSAQKIGLPKPDIIKNMTKLIDVLLDSNWREWPMIFDVPFSSQIFGQLVSEAGIDGILYASKFTDNDCLAIFPQNFDKSSESFIELDDAAPPGVKIRRMDARMWSAINGLDK